MSKINDGGAAFPRPQAETSIGGNYEQDGMSLRDYFAGQALVGFSQIHVIHGTPYKSLAKSAYEAADAMIAYRQESGQ